jgi:transcriptional regulator with XRE-family HTH domain
MNETMTVGTARAPRGATSPAKPTTLGPSAALRLAQNRTAETPGDRLKMRRSQIGLKQDEVAEQLGLSRTAYCQYETNSSKLTVDRAAEVADILGVSRNWLAFGEGPMEAIRQIAFKSGKITKVSEWGLNEQWVEAAFHGLKTSDLLIYVATVDGAATRVGDAVLLEKVETLEEGRNGEYLCIVDGTAQLANLSRRSANGAIRVSGGPKSGSFPAADVIIAGRVLAKLGSGAD